VRVVVAMDSFKGSLTAGQACAAVARGVRAAVPGAEIVIVPMADGGEGTAEALLGAVGGEWVHVSVMGPLPEMRVSARFAWLAGSKRSAVVEMASASGIELLRPDELDPLRATTFGTGQLMAAARAVGANKIRLAIGGSATVDGGTGAARALGWRFLDAEGEEVPLGGEGLEAICRVAPPRSEGSGGPEVEVLCDVENPLLGPEGAAGVFGPQKGATPAVVERLEAGLSNLARVIERDLALDVRRIVGGGAAGGLGAGAVAFFGASLVSGVQSVMDATGFDALLAGADWLVIGEGRFDEQSLHGKVVSGVVERVRRRDCAVAVLAGSVAVDGERAALYGISALEAAAPAGLPLAEAMENAERLLETAAGRLARKLRTRA